MVPMGHARARDSNTGDDRGNLETQLKNLAPFGPSDECIFQDVAIGRSVPGTRVALYLLRLKSTVPLPKPRSIVHTRSHTASDNAMLILHAADVQGNLVLWAEDSDSHNEPPELEKAGKHPHCARAQLLAEAVGLETSDSSFASAIAWLPTLGDAPILSSPMAGAMPKSRAKPRIRPWTLTALRLRPEQAVSLLRACHQRHVLKPGVAIGTDLAYWTHALQLAQSLTSRQQFLPSLSERDGQTVATWMPVFIGEDAHRLAELAGLMPAAVRRGKRGQGTAWRGPDAVEMYDAECGGHTRGMLTACGFGLTDASTPRPALPPRTVASTDRSSSFCGNCK